MVRRMGKIVKEFRNKNPHVKEFYGIRPFTLEWWMYLEWMAREQTNHSIAGHNNAIYRSGCDSKEAVRHEKNIRRYREIVSWIRERIIKKYGESNLRQ